MNDGGRHPAGMTAAEFFALPVAHPLTEGWLLQPLRRRDDSLGKVDAEGGIWIYAIHPDGSWARQSVG